MEVRGIVTDSPKGKLRTRILLRGPQPDIYRYVDITGTDIDDETKIKEAVKKELKTDELTFTWPHHLKRPKTEKEKQWTGSSLSPSSPGLSGR